LEVILVWILHTVFWYSLSLASAIVSQRSRPMTMGHAFGVSVFSGSGHLIICYLAKHGGCL